MCKMVGELVGKRIIYPIILEGQKDKNLDLWSAKEMAQSPNQPLEALLRNAEIQEDWVCLAFGDINNLPRPTSATCYHNYIIQRYP